MIRITLCGMCLLTLLLPVAAQQLAFPDGPQIITESTPPDDAVLNLPPVALQLNFISRVRLVKLTLYNEKRDWVDIDFRYDPQPGTQFSWPVPALDAAQFYTAEWAVLSSDQRLWRGSFSFSFGANAEPPSRTRERLQLLLELSDELPLLQELEQLGLDPAEIIINGQPAPVFEPPFAPILN